MQSSFWKALRHRVEWLACAALAWAIPRLSRRLCVAIAYGLGGLAYYVDARGRRVALANLACVFPEKPEAERRRIAKLSYQNFARTMLDLFWSRRLTRENWRRYIEVEVDEEGFRREAREHGAVSMCIHWGNFEWSSHAVGFLEVPTLIVAEPFKNPLLSAIFNGAREVSGHTIIPQENSMIRLLKVVKRHGAAGMLVDLTLNPDQASVPITAFGRKMCVSILHAVLSQRGGARMFPVDGIPLPDGRCRIVINPALPIPAGASVLEIAQACWDFYESRIRERPELYLWAYKHWRYRPRDAAPEDYPFYANVSSKFEKLLTATAAAKR
ncbi:MAG: lysophospholipid acyltransferase family protein [Chthoniobacteraceae bacterium]|nr:lysophospholipid acyltransferase family protein [Chthoniobacteraceae bacterium]